MLVTNLRLIWCAGRVGGGGGGCAPTQDAQVPRLQSEGVRSVRSVPGPPLMTALVAAQHQPVGRVRRYLLYGDQDDQFGGAAMAAHRTPPVRR